MDVGYRITLNVEHKSPTMWVVTSPQIGGLLVAGETMSSALAEVPKAVMNLMLAIQPQNQPISIQFPRSNL